MNNWKLSTIVLLILTATLLPGCAFITPQSSISADETPLTQLLYYSRAVQRASPSGRLAMLAAAKEEYEEQPTPEAAARLALAYGQPDYKGYAPENGWRYAQKALAGKNHHWGPAAVVFLHQFAALCADNDKVRDQLKHALQHRDTADKRLATLQQELSQAKQKLQALTEIETKLSP